MTIRVEQFLKELEQSKEKYDLAIILGGTNDIAMGYDEEMVFEGIKEMHERFHKVIFFSIIN